MKNIHKIKQGWIQNDLPLAILAVFFIISTAYFTFKQHYILHSPHTVSSFLKSTLIRSRECSSLYLRVRPDPYFFLRKVNPKMEILEFVPGKLQSEKNQRDLFSRYDKIECFLLDSNDSWEPGVTEYLSLNKNRFVITYFNFSDPIGENRLFVRQKL
jgi:hypothetical protein